MIRLEHVCKDFDAKPVIRGVSLEVSEGEVLAVIGPSGAGKTTLIRLMNTTLKPTSGRVWVKGKDVLKLDGGSLRKVRASIGTIYQEFNLIPRVKVIHNVLAGALGRWSTLKSLVSLIRPRDYERALEALSVVGMEDKVLSRTDELSGGEKQRVAIARVLLQDPDIILADEPIANLDPVLAEEIITLLLDINRRLGKTLVVVLHQMEFTLDYFPRILGVRDGRLLFDRRSERVSEALLSDLYNSERLRGEAYPRAERKLRQLYGLT